MAAPIPPNPAPTMTASNCSEVMRKTVPEVPAIALSDPARFGFSVAMHVTARSPWSHVSCVG